MNLETTYLGMKLKNPLVPSASPLSKDLDMARKLEDAGASALVMYSLFEEEIIAEEEKLEQMMGFQDIGHGEADSYLPLHHGYKTQLEEYLEQLANLKQALDIPVIASLNGVSDGGWVEHARELEAAGADALELNLYLIPAMQESAESVEQRYIDVIKHLKSSISLPVTVKLSPYFSSLGNLVLQLEQAGAEGVSLFNRFYQPDLDLDTLEINPVLHLSEPYEALLRMHWIARLCGRVDLSLAATGGIHGVEQVSKMLLAGANITHLCSVLLQQGPQVITSILSDLSHWMEEKEYSSVEQLTGSVCQIHAPDPVAYDRANYLTVLKHYR